MKSAMPVVPLVTGADVVVVAAGVSVVGGEVVADSTLYVDQYDLASCDPIVLKVTYPAEVVSASLTLLSSLPLDLRERPTPAPTPTAIAMTNTTAIAMIQVHFRRFPGRDCAISPADTVAPAFSALWSP